jgi:hypothetical protein
VARAAGFARGIPPGPPARVVALAFAGALEGTVIEQAPHDEVLATRAAAGALAIDLAARSIE